MTLVPRLIGLTETATKTKAARTRTRNRWGEQELVDAFRSSTVGPTGERMVRLYKWMRDQGARPSWGTGGMPTVVMWLGERDDERSNPVAIAMSGNQLAIFFSFVRGLRSEEQMHKLAMQMRTIPGVAGYTTGLEDDDFRKSPPMKPADVLGSDEGLTAWESALEAAAAPA